MQGGVEQGEELPLSRGSLQAHILGRAVGRAEGQRSPECQTPGQPLWLLCGSPVGLWAGLFAGMETVGCGHAVQPYLAPPWHSLAFTSVSPAGVPLVHSREPEDLEQQMCAHLPDPQTQCSPPAQTDR